MATNLLINEELLEEAKKIGGHKTKRSAVNEALKEYIERRKQLDIADLFGKVEYFEDYDYKKLRTRK